MEMPGRWKVWKTKNRFPTLPTGPWKSRIPREISTFPTAPACAGWKSGKPKPGFPLFHAAHATTTTRSISSNPKPKERKSAAARPPHPSKLLCVIKYFHDHSWIGKCSPRGPGVGELPSWTARISRYPADIDGAVQRSAVRPDARGPISMQPADRSLNSRRPPIPRPG